MLTLPQKFISTFTPFMQVFSSRIWDWAQVLIVGAILAPGKRAASSILHIIGLKDEKQYQNYYRALNRAKWSWLHTGSQSQDERSERKAAQDHG